MHCEQERFTVGGQGRFNIWVSINVTPHYQQATIGKPQGHINWCRKNIWQNSIHIHDDSAQQTRNRSDPPQLDLKNLRILHVIVRKWMLSHQDQKRQGCPLAPLGVLDNKGNKIYTLAGKNKVVFAHRWHDALCRKSQKMDNKTSGAKQSQVTGYQVNI